MKRLLLIVLLLIVGCSKPVNEETLIEKGGLKYHPDTKELYSGEVFQNRMGGEKEFEGSYKDGKQDGKWTYWYENGQKESERTYKDGKQDGKWTFWNYKGEKRGEGTFKDGKKDGLWSYSHDDQQKILEVTFKDGVENGLWTQWYLNGKKRYEGNIKGEEGFRTEWYKNGQKKSEEKNVKIFPNYPFSLPPSLKFKRNSVIWSYSNRTIDRLYTKWYENGQKKEDWDINDGDGKVTYWFENGQKEFENTYKDGKEVPKSYKEWNEDGSVKEVKKEYKTIKELFGSP